MIMENRSKNITITDVDGFDVDGFDADVGVEVVDVDVLPRS